MIGFVPQKAVLDAMPDAAISCAADIDRTGPDEDGPDEPEADDPEDELLEQAARVNAPVRAIAPDSIFLFV